MQIEGRNAVLEALKNRGIDKLYIKNTEADGSLRVILKLAADGKVPVIKLDGKLLDKMSESGKHQGVIALCPEYSYAEVSDFFALAEQKAEPPFIVVLDGITDPHNLGAIIRSAEAAGVHGIIIPKRRAATVNAVVAKVSAGALAHVLIARVTNISREIQELKQRNCWVFGADMHGALHYQSDLKGPIALVIGDEGEGISKLVLEQCDFKIKIPMRGQISSLNASVAAGVLMYEALRQRTLG